VFLPDEPLSNLDAALRGQIRTGPIGRYHRLATTLVYATHDQTEAMTLGTTIVVMKDGVVQQADTPDAVYSRPANRFVAGFIGSPMMNFISVTVEKLGDTALLSFAGRRLPLPREKGAALFSAGYAGKEIVPGIRPEHITCLPEGESDHTQSMKTTKGNRGNAWNGYNPPPGLCRCKAGNQSGYARRQGAGGTLPCFSAAGARPSL
jgi:ABC-type sugar transport system ATPase subunit